METGTELELPFLPMGEDAFAADPFPHFDAARKQHPWLARWPLGYVVTDYKAMRDFFVMEDKMVPIFASMVDIFDAHGTPWGEFQRRHVLSRSGESHSQLRKVVASSFTPRRANQHRPLMREVINELLDEWAPKGAFDFEEFASYFPITVMCRLIGASPEVIPSLRSALEAIGMSASMDKRWLPAMQEGLATMDAVNADLVAERRADPRHGQAEDLLDLLLTTHEEGGMTERELFDMLIFLFVAGYDTSKNMLTLCMHVLIDHPEIYRRCGQDHGYALKAMNEVFRLHSTTSNQRFLTEDVVYRDVLLEKGALVWFPLSVATHDPRYVEDYERFDPDRERTTQPIAFGLGEHICLGQYIARAQIHEGLHLIAQRIHNPRSPGPKGYRPFPGTWGLRGLPIEYDRAPAYA